jgi:hypothetical protein
MKANGVWIGCAVLALVATVMIGAESKDKTAKQKAESKPPALVKPSAPQKVQPLGKTLKLTFGVKLPEVPGITIYSATRTFAISSQIQADDGYINMDVSGHIQLIDKDPKRVLLVYQVLLDLEGDGNTLNTSASGSCLVKFGKETKLLQSAGQDFVVKIEEVE